MRNHNQILFTIHQPISVIFTRITSLFLSEEKQLPNRSTNATMSINTFARSILVRFSTIRSIFGFPVISEHAFRQIRRLLLAEALHEVASVEDTVGPS